jgi:FkbM family methyltransferase
MIKRVFQSVVGRYKQFTFRPHIINRQIAGEEIDFLIGDLFGAGWYGPHHEPWPELEWIKSHGVRSGDVIVDCGANHGFTTVLFAKWAGPSGRVFAFEPLEHNMKILRENLRLNGVENVSTHQVAVGADNMTILITTHSNGTVVRHPHLTKCFREVPLRKLDDEVISDKVNFLKIDVEGFELEVLQGAKNILSGQPRLAIELHVFLYEDKVKRLRDIFDLINLDSYNVEIQHEVDGPIRKFNRQVDTLESLASYEVVHLFCV